MEAQCFQLGIGDNTHSIQVGPSNAHATSGSFAAEIESQLSQMGIEGQTGTRAPQINSQMLKKAVHTNLG